MSPAGFEPTFPGSERPQTNVFTSWSLGLATPFITEVNNELSLHPIHFHKVVLKKKQGRFIFNNDWAI